ncbi:hypothetical protein IX51_00020 [uncultured archaeon]|nr:hypothetical protein IX51_00020 [uncultured archaeon]
MTIGIIRNKTISGSLIALSIGIIMLGFYVLKLEGVSPFAVGLFLVFESIAYPAWFARSIIMTLTDRRKLFLFIRS